MKSFKEKEKKKGANKWIKNSFFYQKKCLMAKVNPHA